MAIVEVGSGASNGSNSGSAISITHGLTILEDDIVIAVCHSNGSGTNHTDNNGANSFTKEYDDQSQSSSHYTIFTRVAGASEPSAYAFTATSSNAWSVTIRVFRGVDTASIWDVAPADINADGGNSSTGTAPTITTLTDGALGLLIALSDSSSRSFSAPTNGYGSVLSHSANRSQGSAHRIFSTAGATGTADFTLSGNDDWHIHQVALKPVVSAGISVVGVTSAANYSAIVGAVDLTPHIEISGVASSCSWSPINGAIDLTGTITVNGVASNTNWAGINGAIDLTSVINVLGGSVSASYSAYQGVIELTSAIQVSGQTSSFSWSSINGAVVLTGAIAVVGATTSYSLGVISGQVDLTGTISVSGASIGANWRPHAGIIDLTPSISIHGSTSVCEWQSQNGVADLTPVIAVNGATVAESWSAVSGLPLTTINVLGVTSKSSWASIGGTISTGVISITGQTSAFSWQAVSWLPPVSNIIGINTHGFISGNGLNAGSSISSAGDSVTGSMSADGVQVGGFVNISGHSTIGPISNYGLAV